MSQGAPLIALVGEVHVVEELAVVASVAQQRMPRCDWMVLA